MDQLLNLEKQTGFRSVEIIREKDSKGESFVVKVNGKPIFLKELIGYLQILLQRD